MSHSKKHYSTRYTSNMTGCYADGSFGHKHVREVLAQLISYCDEEASKSLLGDMPDDAWDEDAALDLLQEHTADGLYWSFEGGDLVLMERDEE